AVRVGHGPDRRHPAAVRRQVLPDRHPVPGVRRRAALPLPVGGGHVPAGPGRGGGGPRRGRDTAGGVDRPVPHRDLLGGDRLPRHAGRRLRVRVEEGGVPMAVDLPDNVVVSKLDVLANWCRKNSLWPLPFATACCGIEVMAVGASRHDIARFGAEAMRFSPRQCDLMIVAGRVVMKMMPVLQRIWLQMPEPKWCISMGACASSGGVFDTYAVVQGVDRFMPVDVYIPGCPPRPEQVLQAVIDLQAQITRSGTLTGKEFAQRTRFEGPRPLALQLSPEETVVAPGDFAHATRLQSRRPEGDR